jgi:hypothetical protein
MSIIKKKYKKTPGDLIQTLIKSSRKTTILSIDMVNTSKVQGCLIYDCVYLDNGIVKNISIIAEDITAAMIKLEPYIEKSIPAMTVSYLIGSEKFEKLKNEN